MTALLSIVELLDRLNQVDESHEIEAKRGESSVGKSALETISAFSNEPALGGGYLLLGVAEDETAGHFTVTGVRDPKKLEQQLSTLCASSFNRAVRPKIWTDVVSGKSVIAAFIPEVSAPEKPVFVASQGVQHGTYRRIGSTDQRCTEDDLRVLFRAGDTTAYEDALVNDTDEADLDLDVVAIYRKQLLDANPATELRDATPLELIQSVGGSRHVEGRIVPTVAGLLLFGRRLSLRRVFPQLRIDYIRVPGTRWVPDADHRYDSIDVRDPLLLAFRRAYQAITDDLPRSFVLEAGSPERRDRTAVPEAVVREALVNALTHRDYRIQSATQIIRYSDRIEIRNPGHSLVGEEQFGQPGSFPRNPRVADVFREMRLAENKGTGIEAMRRAMKLADLTPPVFSSDPRGDRFVTTLWLHSLLDETELAWLRTLNQELTSAQRQALVVARRTGSVTNIGLRDLTGLDPLQARRELHALRDAGLLAMLGERGGAYYVLAPAAQPGAGIGTAEAARGSERGADSTGPRDGSTGPPARSTGPRNGSTGPPARSTGPGRRSNRATARAGGHG